MQLRTVRPAELEAIAQLAAANADLVALPAELAQLRALKAAGAAQGGPVAPLRPASVRELLQLLERGVLSPSEAHGFLGLPPRRGTLATLLVGIAAALQVVVSALAGGPRLRPAGR